MRLVVCRLNGVLYKIHYTCTGWSPPIGAMARQLGDSAGERRDNEILTPRIGAPARARHLRPETYTRTRVDT